MSPAQALPALVTERLSPPQVRLAFPLMRQVVPELTLTGWLRFARRMVGRTGSASQGILVARRHSAPYLCGAVCYRRDHDVRLGAVLTAEHFVAVDLLHPNLVLDALECGLEEVAASLKCEAVRALVHVPETARDLRASGHEWTGEVLVRGLRQAPQLSPVA